MPTVSDDGMEVVVIVTGAGDAGIKYPETSTMALIEPEALKRLALPA